MSGKSFTHRIQFSDDGGKLYDLLAKIDPSLRIDRIRQLIMLGIVYESMMQSGQSPFKSHIPTPLSTTIEMQQTGNQVSEVQVESQKESTELAGPCLEDVMCFLQTE